ncbi:DUF2254 domain-containing protein [Myxococcus sp. K38C18041901]|uniref:DUF2254 domain-containing protein n=1 Tax=Myxococcus guangdongensis TaxID=2906760 RepID=UPI0020A7403E|nr:DUF2254 domain-containing protein [Myxococcus guangdongensis]MCP3063246.1 DUF2254 domain-containing protein [Myxococcus guangdongensis]
MAATQVLPRAGAWAGAGRRRDEGRSFHEWRRHRLWVPPLVGALLGASLGIFFVSPGAPVVRGLSGAAWSATPAEARSMLSTVLGVSLTSLSIVLSLSMLVVQNAAGQYSPRLLRLYLHSAGIRVVIPVFIATSVFCLVAAHEFGLVAQVGRVPRPALALAMWLLVVCEGALVFQVLQTLQLMRVENLVRRVRVDTLAVARGLEPLRAEDVRVPGTSGSRAEDGASGSSVADLDGPGASGSRTAASWPLRAVGSGFIVAVDARALLAVATARGLVVHLERAVGEPVVRGEQVGWVVSGTWGQAAGREETAALVSRAIRLGRWRDEARDVSLGVRQLVDVATRALSPGINDPYTAVEALDQLTFLLRELGSMHLGPRVLPDGAGTPRVFLRSPSLRDHLEQVTEPVLRYGATEPSVMLRLLRLLATVARDAREDADRGAARAQLHDLRTTSEHAVVRHHAEALEHALQGAPWPPLPAIGF